MSHASPSGLYKAMHQWFTLPNRWTSLTSCSKALWLILWEFGGTQTSNS